MQLQEVIDRRRTVREFSVRPVRDKVIDKALAAGLKAPCYNHLRQWEFVLVNDPRIRLELTRTEDMSDELGAKTVSLLEGIDPVARDMYLYAMPLQKRMLLTAPGLVCVLYKPVKAVKDAKRVYDLNCHASVWCCIENMLLSFAEDDVYCATFISQNTQKVREVLGIPNTLEVAAMVAFGYRAEGAKEIEQKPADLELRKHVDRY